MCTLSVMREAGGQIQACALGNVSVLDVPSRRAHGM